MAALSGRWRVSLSPASTLPGDEAIVVDLDAPTDASPAGLARSRPGAFIGEPVVGRDGIVRLEVVVDGWRFELDLEDEDRARLRRRATRDRDAGATSGPTEIRAIIPGRVAAVRVASGDPVETGAGLLVVEAMKMQNELRAPRAGTIERVAVAVGATIELGDLLVVLR